MTLNLRKLVFMAAAVAVGIALTGCPNGNNGDTTTTTPPVYEPTSGALERLTLENGAYAAFRFDLPPDTIWSDFDRLTVDYWVDSENMEIPQRGGNQARLMGVYVEDDFQISNGIRFANLADGPTSANAPFIMDNAGRSFTDIGAVAGRWFTVTYDISGAAAHAAFEAANIPAATATGPFFFGLGIPGAAAGITQYVRNITLHHATDATLNAVSTGSGFDEPTFVSFSPVASTREAVTD